LTDPSESFEEILEELFPDYEMTQFSDLLASTFREALQTLVERVKAQQHSPQSESTCIYAIVQELIQQKNERRETIDKEMFETIFLSEKRERTTLLKSLLTEIGKKNPKMDVQVQTALLLALKEDDSPHFWNRLTSRIRYIIEPVSSRCESLLEDFERSIPSLLVFIPVSRRAVLEMEEAHRNGWAEGQEFEVIFERIPKSFLPTVLGGLEKVFNHPEFQESLRTYLELNLL
jgi:hypothetical protein